MFRYIAVLLLILTSNVPAQEPAPSAAGARKVLILGPELAFEKIQDQSPLDPEQFGGANAERQLAVAADRVLRSKGFSIVVPEKLPIDAAELESKLRPLTGRLGRASLAADSQASLAEIAQHLDGALIFAQYFRARIGAKGWYSPISGELRSGQNQTLVAAALIDPASGTVVWKNEVLVRKILSANPVDLEKAMTTLYATLR